MIVKWLGHASYSLKIQGVTVYIDPYAGEYVETADIILITHSHRDHCDLEKVKAIQRPDTVLLTTPKCAQELTGNIIQLTPGDKRIIQGVAVEAVEAYNYTRFRSPGVPYHPKGDQIGVIISTEGKQVYHASDTDFIPEMKQLKRRNIDVALLPCGGRYTMDLDEAIEAAVAIHPKIAIPMHLREASAEEFKRKLEALSDIKVVTLGEGEEVTL